MSFFKSLYKSLENHIEMVTNGMKNHILRTNAHLNKCAENQKE